MTDYRVYRLSFKETIEYYLLGFSLSIMLGMLFYNNIYIACSLCIFSPMFIGKYKSYKCDKRKALLLEAFKDALYCISGSVAAGRQMPQAIEDAAMQAEMFSGVLKDELQHIVLVYKEVHGKIGELLADLGERSGIEEIKLFAASYVICQKSGGDLESVCLKSAYLLIDRIDYQKEVSAVLSEKKLDSLILLSMPLIILLFLNLSSPDYIAILYESIEGRIVMSICLLMMLVAALWSLKIMKLEL